jgi:hypothetical protein
MELVRLPHDPRNPPMVGRADLNRLVAIKISPGFLLSRFSIARSYRASGVPDISTAKAMNLAMGDCHAPGGILEWQCRDEISCQG